MAIPKWAQWSLQGWKNVSAQIEHQWVELDCSVWECLVKAGFQKPTSTPLRVDNPYFVCLDVLAWSATYGTSETISDAIKEKKEIGELNDRIQYHVACLAENIKRRDDLLKPERVVESVLNQRADLWELFERCASSFSEWKSVCGFEDFIRTAAGMTIPGPEIADLIDALWIDEWTSTSLDKQESINWSSYEFRESLDSIAVSRKRTAAPERILDARLKQRGVREYLSDDAVATLCSIAFNKSPMMGASVKQRRFRDTKKKDKKTP